MKKFFVFLLLLSFSFLGKPLEAQVFLEKGKVVYDVQEEERISESIMIHNTSSQPVDLSM